MKIALLSALFTSLSFNSYSCTGFFEDVELHYPQNKNFMMDQKIKSDFEKYSKEFIEVSKSFIPSDKKIIINLNWDESKFNANATRDMEDNLLINVNGGMARNPHMDKMSYFLILCHELGHYVGGAPRKLRGQSTKRSWASVEGQADYFATAKCMRSIIQHPNKSQYIIDASLNVARLFSETQHYSRSVSLENKDDYVTWETVQDHPSPQCRLDTFIAGLNCPVSESEMFDPNDPKIGSCYRENEQEETPFARPFCWYSPITK